MHQLLSSASTFIQLKNIAHTYNIAELYSISDFSCRKIVITTFVLMPNLAI